ncbi:hypothetical protein RYZ27_01250 [Hyphomonas sp. FCG-A18]|uniref:phage terminase large subunit family protein n=1 Tax=Hyphomonas sp. FCG-A18 TaxID=3080019 RepID=UPI002B284ECE|nr:hypothetical protein RYZ27_01250 [Hyphomonas sp. FCG-A18]
MKHLVVERDGLGRQVLEELASRMDFEDRYKHLHGMSTKGESKIYRMEQAMVTVRQGRVFIREREWAEPLINELQMFPTGPHNDQVDALSQAIKFVRNFGPPKLNARVTIL